MLYFRRKLSNSNPKVVVLTFRLLESLMSNCDDKFYSCVNEKSFINEISKTARKYCSKVGPENREAAEVSLDVIQAWGEAFLTKRNRYPNITELYFNLRKEGLPFKKDNQFAASRVPIFNDSFLGLPDNNDSNDKSRRSSNGSASSNKKEGTNAIHTHAPPPQQQRQPQQQPVTRQPQKEVDEVDSQPILPVNELISSLNFFVSLFCDLVTSCDDNKPYSDSEVTAEVMQSVRQLQLQMNNAIEETLSNDPEVSLILFNSYKSIIIESIGPIGSQRRGTDSVIRSSAVKEQIYPGAQSESVAF